MKKNKIFFDQNLFFLFLNSIIKKGKKLFAYKILITLFNLLKLELKKNSTLILINALLNSKIFIKFYSKKKGRHIHKIPLFLQENTQVKKGFFMLLNIIKNIRKERLFLNRLHLEISDLYKYKGYTILQKNNLYSLAADCRRNFFKFKKFKKKFKKKKKFFAKALESSKNYNEII